MQDWLAASAAANPDHPALISDSHTWSYADLDAHVSVMCRWLAGERIQRGDHVGVLLPNCPEYVLLIHVLARLGAVLVPLNVRLTPDEIAWQAGWADCAILLCNESTAAKAGGIRAPILQIETFTPLEPQPEAAGKAPDGNIDLNSVQSIVFTSGTTGKPKGAQITFGNHFWSATASSWRLGVLPHDRWLLVMPLYHVGGMSIVFRSALYGTAIVLHDGFDAERVWHSMETQAITLISVVPTMLHRLLDARPGQLFPSSVRLVLLGGAAASPALIERCMAQNVPVATTYGLTEACSQVATMMPDDVARKPGSVGRPILFSRVRIADAQGHTLPPGEHGEVIVSGQTVMAGYYKQHDERTLRDGELHTGDIGYLDDDGDLWIVQRRSDLIVSGGENVYPAEVEHVLSQHPAVSEVAVVGIPSEEWGQQVAAAVVLRQETVATAEILDAFCRQQLAAYKCPRRYLLVASLPQTGSGKISRKAVAELFASA